MNNTQNQIINMLSASIRKKNIEMPQNIDWNELLDEGDEHKVTPLLYTSISKNNLLAINDKEMINKLKKKVFTSSLGQASHIKNVASILEEFNKADIPVIVLKGLVVRYLYPIPDLRTMCDADVLVHKDDLEKVSQLMISLGYAKTKEEEDHGAHLVFHNGRTIFEVHWTLINDSFFSGDKTKFESNLWENAIEVEVGGVKTLSLSLEDLAVHLCTHMAVHLAYSGFGIRQPLDLVLLVEKKGEEIDWNSFLNKIKICEIYKFTIAIFIMCNKLFNMEIPDIIKKECNIKNEYIDLLIEEIFASGVYGKKDKNRVFANELAFNQGEGATSGRFGVFKKFIKLLFPSINDMNDKYSYAKKYSILVPIAWIHHLIEGIKNNDYSFDTKVKMATSTITVANKRNKLLKELEL